MIRSAIRMSSSRFSPYEDSGKWADKLEDEASNSKDEGFKKEKAVVALGRRYHRSLLYEDVFEHARMDYKPKPSPISAATPQHDSSRLGHLYSDSNSGFPVGREKELAQIDQLLQTDVGPVVVLCGEGGVGKTFLAEFYARRHHQGFFVWLKCRNFYTLKQSFISACQWRHAVSECSCLETIHSLSTFKEACDAFAEWLLTDDAHLALLVFDDYKGPIYAEAGTFELRSLLRFSHHKCVIVTTRSRNVAIGYQIAVGNRLSAEDGAQLIVRSAERIKFSSGGLL